MDCTWTDYSLTKMAYSTLVERINNCRDFSIANYDFGVCKRAKIIDPNCDFLCDTCYSS